MRYGFVIDNRKCIGCHACSTACKSENEVPIGVNRTWVKSIEVGAYPDVVRKFQVTRCNHCENPPCVAICPVTAMYQTDNGIVEFDSERCIGCKACIQACPYDAVHIDPTSNTAAKCHFCAHRIDQGLEPACVVVCPEHAIIAGDMDDPESEISQTLRKHQTVVRKPEQGTRPKLSYIEGVPEMLNPDFQLGKNAPLYASAGRQDSLKKMPIRVAEQMQTSYNAPQKEYWDWKVSAYILSKGIASGLFLILALFQGLKLPDHLFKMELVGLISLLFLLITTGLLVADLKRPERFLYILMRPQWRSWLTRGAYILVGFSLCLTFWVVNLFALDWGFVSSDRAQTIHVGIQIPALVLSVLTAAYTGFLFWQAEGRDLWQHKLMPVNFSIRSLVAGSAAGGLLALIFGSQVFETAFIRANQTFFAVGLAISLILLLVEFYGPVASSVESQGKALLKGPLYRNMFLGGGMVFGHILPLAGILLGGELLIGLSFLAALVGLFALEHAVVVAGQAVPNS